jgi:hypothetical protein
MARAVARGKHAREEKHFTAESAELYEKENASLNAKTLVHSAFQLPTTLSQRPLYQPNRNYNFLTGLL